MHNTTPFTKLLVFMLAMIPFALFAQNSNIAKGKPAKQSSNGQELIGTADKAVDGNTNGNWVQNSTNSITHTAGEKNPWWEVDLGGIFDISEITIWNRKDCCQEWLQNFHIMVSEEPITAISTSLFQFTAEAQSFAAGSNQSKSITGNKKGRYVRIFIQSDKQVLALAEVEVKGTPATATPPSWVSVAKGKTAKQSSDGVAIEKGGAAKAVDGNTSGGWVENNTNTITHTGSDNNPWWEVDLGGIFDISEIKIWNRMDCCQERLQNFYIMVSEDPIAATSTSLFQFTTAAQSFTNPTIPSMTIVGNKKGRYVRVFIQGDKKTLSLAEVEVRGTPAAATPTSWVSVAKGKTAKQSSDGVGEAGVASKAVDGNTSGHWTANNTNSFTHTNEENNPWWEVDLGSFYDISEIRIWNRTDCCQERLQDFHIMVSEEPISAISTSLFQFKAGAQTFAAGSESMLLRGNRKGRYVRVFIPGNKKTLSLAEVEIKGTPTSGVNIAKGKTARQSSGGSNAAKAVDGQTTGTWVSGDGNTITHTTAGENNQWWEVDLGAVHDISEIRIYNRTDECCWKLLSDFYIMVSEVPITANSTTDKQYGSGPMSFTGAEEERKIITKTAKGRFVRIFKQNNSQLSLAEVEVMGKLTYNPATAGKKFIVADPDPIDEGIWFVIQNKSDVDTDLEIPARALALRSNGQAVPTMTAIPLTGKIDEFLWRTIKVNGIHKLINKQLGDGFALDCSQQNPTIGQFGDKVGQQWSIERSNTVNHGTNAYTLSNTFITNGKALQYSDNAITVASKNSGDTRQCWVFQPMDIVTGYLLPTGGAYGFDRRLLLPCGYELVASTTVTDWGLLNAHLIYKNMLNALHANHSAKIQGYTGEKIAIIISKDDPNEVNINTPYLYPDYTTPSVAKYRGGVIGGKVLITEEMMNKVGVVNGTEPDTDRREFDQVVHEMVHAFDDMCGLETRKLSVAMTSPSFVAMPEEWFPWKVQLWFHASYSKGATQTRKALKADEATYLNTVFNPSNSWTPPRWLRDR